MYQFSWLPGGLVSPERREELAKLYSEHYGKWGHQGIRPGHHVSLSAAKMSEWLTPDAHVVWASLFDQIVGYAIAIQSDYGGQGSVAWVTQLVVHEDHRNRDIGKRLLFSIWKFTDHSAWGVLSANPYAIRALEKATRRRCSPMRIKVDVKRLLRLGKKQIAYVGADSTTHVTESESRINTEFFLDHSDLPTMLRTVTTGSNPWSLGPLPEGWEWFAFTFKDQPQISLSKQELAEMMSASDQVTQEAFSRMRLTDSAHRWAAHAELEAELIENFLELGSHSRILDFGCGAGRHSIALAKRGHSVVAVDYVRAFIEQAQSLSYEAKISQLIEFKVADCRKIDFKDKFAAAVCLYDVVGTYAEPHDNFQLLHNLAAQLAPGGKLLLSVMNLELTKQKAERWFSISEDPDALLSLPPSSIMEESGDIFDPNYYMVDKDTDIVYRKEQFRHGDAIPEEMIVRDRRYTLEQIVGLCHEVGLVVRWARRVRAGHWIEDLPEGHMRAKEILVLCELPLDAAQQRLF